MKVREGERRRPSDEIASFAADRLTGDSALPRGGMDRPAAAGPGSLQDGKSCRLACLEVASDDFLSGTSFKGRL